MLDTNYHELLMSKAISSTFVSWIDIRVTFGRQGESRISGLLKTVPMWIVIDVIYCSIVHILDSRAVGAC